MSADDCLMILEVVNYGLLGNAIEARMPDGEKVYLSIPESQQAKFRAAMVKIRDDGARKTSFEKVLDDE